MPDQDSPDPNLRENARKDTSISSRGGSSTGDAETHGPTNENPPPHAPRRALRPPPTRTSSPLSKNGIRTYLANGTRVGVSPTLINEAFRQLEEVLARLRQQAWKGRALESRRLRRAPSPEIALRHLQIPVDAATDLDETKEAP